MHLGGIKTGSHELKRSSDQEGVLAAGAGARTPLELLLSMYLLVSDRISTALEEVSLGERIGCRLMCGDAFIIVANLGHCVRSI